MKKSGLRAILQAAMEPDESPATRDSLQALARATAAILAGMPEEQAASQSGLGLDELRALRQEELSRMAAQAGRGKPARTLQFISSVQAARQAGEAQARRARRQVLPSAPPAEAEIAAPNLIELAPDTLQPIPRPAARAIEAPPDTASPHEIEPPERVSILPFAPSAILNEPTGSQTIAMPAIADLSAPLPFAQSSPPSTARTPGAQHAQSDQNAFPSWLKATPAKEDGALPFRKSAPPPAPAGHTEDDALPFRKSALPPPPAPVPQRPSQPPPAPETLTPQDLERIQKITLAQYAYICAVTRMHRGDIAGVLHQFAMTKPVWKALHTLWNDRFSADPVLKQRFEILIEKRMHST